MRLRETKPEGIGGSLACVLQLFLLPDGTPHLTPGGDGKFHLSINRYCFDANAPVLRIESAPGQVTTFNSLVRFQNRYLARSIHIAHTSIRTSTINDPTLSRTARTYAPAEETNITIDLVDPLTTLNQADFNPPANAVPLTDLRAAAIARGVTPGERLSGGLPTYPAQAREWHVQGTVELRATILPDGSLGDLAAISGPRELQDPALENVRGWHYEPWLVGGQPVRVVTLIKVTFSQTY